MLDGQNPAKSIDGVKPIPRLSGENQEPHLAQDPVSAPVAPHTPEQPASVLPTANPPTKPANQASPPLAVVIIAIAAGLSLIGAAIYMQLTSS